MSAVLKLTLLFLVLLVLVMLAEAIGMPLVVRPGYLVVGAFTPLPEPYPISTATAPHRTAISVVNVIFWASLLGAWFVILRPRRTAR